MRKLLFVVASALTTLVLTMTSAAACAHGPRLKIDRLTSGVFLYDWSIEGNLPPSEQYHAVTVFGRFSHCDPHVLYEVHSDFVQDGVSAEGPLGGLGAGELDCAENGSTSFAESFGKPPAGHLHVGWARVSFEVTDGQGHTVATASRRVYIPSDDTGL